MSKAVKADRRKPLAVRGFVPAYHPIAEFLEPLSQADRIGYLLIIASEWAGAQKIGLASTPGTVATAHPAPPGAAPTANSAQPAPQASGANPPRPIP